MSIHIGRYQYAYIPPNDLANLGSFSFEIKFSTTSNGGGGSYWSRATIFGIERAGHDSNDFGVTIIDSRLYTWSGSDGRAYYPEKIINDGTPHIVTWICENYSYKIYLDDELVGSGKGCQSIAWQNLFLGFNGVDGDSYLDITINYLKIWDSALPESKVTKPNYKDPSLKHWYTWQANRDNKLCDFGQPVGAYWNGYLDIDNIDMYNPNHTVIDHKPDYYGPKEE